MRLLSLYHVSGLGIWVWRYSHKGLRGKMLIQNAHIYASLKDIAVFNIIGEDRPCLDFREVLVRF